MNLRQIWGQLTEYFQNVKFTFGNIQKLTVAGKYTEPKAYFWSWTLQGHFGVYPVSLWSTVVILFQWNFYLDPYVPVTVHTNFEIQGEKKYWNTYCVQSEKENVQLHHKTETVAYHMRNYRLLINDRYRRRASWFMDISINFTVNLLWRFIHFFNSV